MPVPLQSLLNNYHIQRLPPNLPSIILGLSWNINCEKSSTKLNPFAFFFFFWPISYDCSHVSTITLKMIFQPYVLALTSIIFILWIKKQERKSTKLSNISCQYQGYEVLPVFYSPCSPSWHFLKMRSTGVALRPQSYSSRLVSLHIPLKPSAPGTHHSLALLSCPDGFGPAVASV